MNSFIPTLPTNRTSEYLTDDDFVYLMNGWDTKSKQLKLHSEKNCTKFKNSNRMKSQGWVLVLKAMATHTR
jgi:hypothetical protein